MSLPKNFLNEFQKIQASNFRNKINDCMLLERDKTKEHYFNEKVTFLNPSSKKILDFEYLELEKKNLVRELVQKTDKILFNEILQDIEIEQKDFNNNKNFINKYFECIGSYSSSWGYPLTDSGGFIYRFKFDEFKSFAWQLRIGVNYLKELKNKHETII